MSESNSPFLSLGIDIGTTTISLTVVDISAHRQLEAFNLPNDSTLPTGASRHEQAPDRIFTLITDSLQRILPAYSGIRAIGLTGQMHGILYVNAAGHAVSPLYTWQDARAAESYDAHNTHCEEIARRTGEIVRPGYGFATHFYNSVNHLVPDSAVSLCTIMDYVAMRLTGRSRPLMHPTNAASLGLFDASKNTFYFGALKQPGFIHLSCPEIAEDAQLVGFYHGIPVAVAIGDNQASFFGSVREEDISLLVNYGTGSQISLLDPDPSAPVPQQLERRPYLRGRYLLCGSALCGGRAYAITEKFFRLYQQAAGHDPVSQYGTLNALAEQALDKNELLPVRTTFCGTRQDPDLTGMISEIREQNFTPGALALGVLRGMADELRGMLPESLSGARHLIASGNAVQKNPVFRRVLADVFGLPVHVPGICEEAALGAALFAACSGSQGAALSAVKACIH